jgi:hypothetical protein
MEIDRNLCRQEVDGDHNIPIRAPHVKCRKHFQKVLPLQRHTSLHLVFTDVVLSGEIPKQGLRKKVDDSSSTQKDVLRAVGQERMWQGEWQRSCFGKI